MYQGIKLAMSKKYTYIGTSKGWTVDPTNSAWGNVVSITGLTPSGLDTFMQNMVSNVFSSHNVPTSGSEGVQDSIYVQMYITYHVKNVSASRVLCNAYFVTPKFDLGANLPVSGTFPISDLSASTWNPAWTYSGAAGSQNTDFYTRFNSLVVIPYPIKQFIRVSRRKSFYLAPGEEIHMKISGRRHISTYYLHQFNSASGRALKHMSHTCLVKFSSELAYHSDPTGTTTTVNPIACAIATSAMTRIVARYNPYTTPTKIYTDTTNVNIPATQIGNVIAPIGGAYTSNTPAVGGI